VGAVAVAMVELLIVLSVYRVGRLCWVERTEGSELYGRLKSQSEGRA
jgi:hypothetical protein